MTRMVKIVSALFVGLSLLLAGCAASNPLAKREKTPAASRDDDRDAGYSAANLQPQAEPESRSAVPGVPESSHQSSYQSSPSPNSYQSPNSYAAGGFAASGRSAPPPRRNAELGEGERMIFDPRVESMPPPADVPLMAPPSLQPIVYGGAPAAAPGRSMFSPGSKPFAGAMVGRANPASVRSMQAKQGGAGKPAGAPGARSQREWVEQGQGPGRPDGGNMLASAPASAQRNNAFIPANLPASPALIRTDEDSNLDDAVREKAASYAAMAAPAAPSGAPLPRAEVSLSAAKPVSTPMPMPAPRTAPVVSAPAPVQAAPQDGIFTPDLFLS